MWNGAAPSLNAIPATMNTSPKTRRLRSVVAAIRETRCATSLIWSVPVAP